ncbi:specificity protein S [Bosea sp. ANAM02]|nr:specificity protein S [Bosea sp. ANAM02]
MGSHWPRRAISELCLDIVDCVNKTAPTVEGPTPFRMIRTTNVKGGFVNLSEVRYVEEATYQQWTRRQVPRRGDIILTREAPLGEVGLLREDEGIFLGQRLMSYRANPKYVDNRFLLYALLGPELQGQIQALGAGSTVAHMRVPDAQRLLIPTPPLAVQERIGSILGAYDDLIEVNRRRIALLEEMARRLFNEWFVRFRFPGHDGFPMVDTAEGAVPKGWSLRQVAGLTSYISRGLAPRYDEAATTLVINQKCIRDQRLSLTSARTQSKAVPVDKLVQLGDVLVNSTGVGTLGRVAQVEAVLEGLTVDTHVTIVRPAAHVDRDFFGLALLRLEPMFERLGAGATGQTELSRARIADVELVEPPSEVQASFGRLVRPMRELSFRLAQQNEALIASRTLLHPRLIGGELSLDEVERELEAAA